MALGDNYANLTDLKGRLGISDTTDDTRLTAALDTASREVELICNRQFNDAGSATARIYPAQSRDLVLVDDFSTTTGLVVASVDVALGGSETSTTLTSTEYRVEPMSTARQGLVDFPYWAIRNLRSLGFSEPPQSYVSVTARWGWASVPKSIKEATLILAEEYFKLKEAPFGIVNWGEFGPMRVTDNRRVMSLLKQYRRGGLRVD